MQMEEQGLILRVLFVAVLVAAAMAFSLGNSAFGAELRCRVIEKVGTPDGMFNPYPPNNIKKYSYSVIIRDRGKNASEMGRCSFSSSAGRVTCDFYPVDHIVKDKNVGHIKYYNFNSQFDVQVFPSMKFLENNGRGSLSSGKCEQIN